MVRIRLRRVGLTHQPSYRIMAADKEAPRDGRFLEILGFYNPRTQPATIEIKEDRLFEWMSKGAQPSESMVKVLNSVGALERYKRFKAGESMEVLQAEAKSVYENRVSSPKTRPTPTQTTK
jgi:small subunit ribosomal protein S16